MLNRIAPPLRAPILGFGLGLVAGGVEVIAHAALVSVHLSLPQGLLLGLTTVGLGGLVGALFAAPVGAVLRFLPSVWAPATRNGAGMAATAGLLAWWYLVPLALEKFDQGLVPAGLAFLATPIGVIGVTWFNSNYWFRREDIGEERFFGWWFVSLVAGLLLGLGGGWSLSNVRYGSPRALEGDPSILLVTVDGLRADVLAEDAGHQLSMLAALAKEGVVYTNAVTPAPTTRAAHGALFTGRHPVRLDLVEPDARLSRGYLTLSEVLEQEGYGTGAFVSTRTLAAASGLNQGFAVYDDDVYGGPVGWSRTRPIATLAAVAPTALPERRSTEQTLARANQWMDAAGPKPFFAWVQLDSPAVALQTGDRARYRSEIDDLNGQLEELVKRASAASGDAPLVVVVTGTSGGLLGEHGATGVDGLWDEVVRVPLVIVPHKLRPKTRVVDLQVRLMDVPATLLDLLRLDPMTHSEGADLLAFAEGFRDKHFATLLVHHTGDAVHLGYRAARADDEGNIKFQWTPGTDAEALYDLVDDPVEAVNIATEQPAATAALRARVLEEAGKLAP